jgi:hypothetical protein
MESRRSLARMYRGAAHYNARLRSRFAFRYWRSSEPLELDMLSGGCFLGRRATFERHGLFDGGYPLYYEDTDLFRRLRAAGLKLWHLPQVRVVHFFSRSALTRMKAALLRHDISAKRFFERWFGDRGFRAVRDLKARADASGAASIPPWPVEEIAAAAAPPRVNLADVPGAYIEIAGNPQFTLAVGIFPEHSGPFEVPRSFYQNLGPATYWMRSVDPASADTLQVWRVVKTAGAGEVA